MKTSYFRVVSDALTNDFPFVSELPRREKSKVVKVWEAFRQMNAMRAEHGAPVPQKVAATLLEVSTTRIDQLVEAGKLTRVDFFGHVYITENSLVEHARSERKTGRPFKVLEECASSPRAAWKIARQGTKDFLEK